MARIKLTADNMCHRPVRGGEAIEELIDVAKKGQAALDAWREKGGDIHRVADASNGIGVLHALVRRGATAQDEAAMALLLAAGVDPNRQNLRGETPLFRASLNRLPNMVRLLVLHGADERIRSRSQKTAEDSMAERDAKEGATQWAAQRQHPRQACREAIQQGRLARELGEAMGVANAKSIRANRTRL